MSRELLPENDVACWLTDDGNRIIEPDNIAAHIEALFSSRRLLCEDWFRLHAENAELRTACEEAASAAGKDWLQQQLKLADLLTRTTEAPK